MTTPSANAHFAVVKIATGEFLVSIRAGTTKWTADRNEAKRYHYGDALRIADKVRQASPGTLSERIGTTDLKWFEDRDKLIAELLALRPAWSAEALAEAMAAEGLNKFYGTRKMLHDLAQYDAALSAK